MIAEWTGADLSFVVDKIGIASRAFLADNETLVSLSQQACNVLFIRNPELKRENVRLLVLVTQNPDYKLPHSSAVLQTALSLPVDTACFDINLGCSGYVYALTIVKALMIAEGITDAVLVTCDPYSKIMGKSDRDTVTVFGDAATATWLSSEVGGEIGRLDFGTDGAGAHHLMVKAGGGAFPVASLWGEKQKEIRPEDYRLTMNGRAIFNFMMQRIPNSVASCLKKNGLALSDVHLFVFHQASKFMVENLGKRLGLDAAKVPCDIRDIGNTVSSSIPVLLSRMLDADGLDGKSVLVSGFGVGLSWATNVIRF